MMRNRFLAMAAVLLIAAGASAAPVGASDARHVANRFWNAYHPSDVKPDPAWVRLDLPEFPHLHVFVAGATGFVVVAGDDCVQPVLAYSFDAPFPEVPHPGLRYWLSGYDVQIAEAVSLGYEPTAEVKEQWESDAADGDTTGSLVEVPMMLSTRWDQGTPYNGMCPYDSYYGQRAVVGCAATAMAQIMKYWNYPAFGVGSSSYVHNRYDTLSADYGTTTYLWHVMPNDVHQFSPRPERDAVALISYHCGVSIEMEYGMSSGAWVLRDYGNSPCVHNALVDYFKYSNELTSRRRTNYGEARWLELIDEEMAGGRPMLYVGYDTSGGHAFVLDGSDVQDRYHFNWGWSGYGDGFYAINNLAPGVSGQAGGNATYTFNSYQGALFNIKPGMVEQFDTVVYYDTICAGTSKTTFRGYTLSVSDSDTLLHHLDTVFHYYLAQVNKRRIRFDGNGANSLPQAQMVCPRDGMTFPQCDFEREGYEFKGWCSQADGSDSLYVPGDYKRYGIVSMYYAIWESTQVGVADVLEGDAVAVWPLPATEELHVSYSRAGSGEVELYDAMGRVCQRATLREGRAKMGVAGLPAGVYILQLRDGEGVYNRRIIKQ